MTSMIYRPDLVEAVDLRAQGIPTISCPAQHKDGWLCTLPLDHGDEHAAGTSGKQFAVIWTYRVPVAVRSRVVDCPACGAVAGALCTAPTDTTRRNVSWVHTSRMDAASGW